MDGSPIDCAANIPTFSPGSTWQRKAINLQIYRSEAMNALKKIKEIKKLNHII